MTGLRDRKKRELRHRIIQAAAERFADTGLDATTMEDVAAAADVSVGTVYNYFGSKKALLLAGVADDTDRMVGAGAVVLAKPGPDPVKAIKRLTGIYLDDLLTWDPRLLREVLSAAYQRFGGDEITMELAAMDQRLIEQMMQLLAHFHAKGKLRRGVEVYDATLLIFSVFVLQLFMFISIDGFEIADLKRQVDRQIELAFAGLSEKKKAKRQ